jgi:hypothetical protein
MPVQQVRFSLSKQLNREKTRHGSYLTMLVTPPKAPRTTEKGKNGRRPQQPIFCDIADNITKQRRRIGRIVTLNQWLE